MKVRAGVYARISLDRHDGAGVERQLEDGLALAERRRWPVVDTYVDNSISAFKRRKRPEWARLMADVGSGRVNTIVCFHSDRTYRRPRDLEDLIDLVEDRDCQIATVLAGDMDLSTPAGRKQARDWASWNRYHVEHMTEQITRERLQRAGRGLPSPGGVRPFGYQSDKVTIEPVEADLIREAAEEVAAGGPMWAVAQRWNEAGVTTSAGNTWEVTAVRRVLTSPRIAGIRVHKGVEVGDASWPGIIDRDTHRRIVAMTSARRVERPSSSEWLLSTLIACPRCGRPLYGSSGKWGRAYKCSPRPNATSCGGASIKAQPAEDRVIETVQGWLDKPPAKLKRSLQSVGRPAVADEVEAIHAQRASLARMFAEGHLPEQEFESNLTVLSARLSALEDTSGATVPSRDVERLAALWGSSLSAATRRPVIEALIDCPMQLVPERMDDPADRLIIKPRW